MSLLKIQNLSIDFKTPRGKLRAVDQVSFSLDAGQTVGLIGESGCGKSVTALAILKLLSCPPAEFRSGEILFEGKDILRMTKSDLRSIRGAKISIIFQEPLTALNPVLSIGEQILEVIALHQKLSRKASRSKSIEMLNRVGIPDAEDRMDYFPHQLSGGLRQRVMIAMALSCQPKLLIADEPTTALDVTIQAQILQLIKELQKEFGMSMIIITHDFGVIAETSDEVAVMYAGKIIEKGSVSSIFDKPAHPYTTGLQQSIPAFKKHGDRLYSIPGMVPDLTTLPKGCYYADRCDYKSAVCIETFPPTIELEEKSHQSACYHPRNYHGIYSKN